MLAKAKHYVYCCVTMSEVGDQVSEVMKPLTDDMVPSEELLRIHLNAINAYAVPTPEEEVALARRIEAGRYASALLSMCVEEPGFLEEQTVAELQTISSDGSHAWQHLLVANQRLVVAEVKRQFDGTVPLLDLIQDGNIDLIKAARSFDYTKGKFSTWAMKWIEPAIRRSQARGWKQENRQILRYDMPRSSDDLAETPLHNFIVDADADVEQGLQIQIRNALLWECLEAAYQNSNAEIQEGLVLLSRHLGLFDERPITWEDLAKEGGKSTYRVKLTARKALYQLGRIMVEHGFENVPLSKLNPLRKVR